MKRVWICLPVLLCTLSLNVANAEDDEKAEPPRRRAAEREGAVKVRWEWPVTIEFKGTPIREAITKVSITAGVNVVIGPKVRGNVTLQAKDMRVIDVLRAIGIQNGHRVVLKNGVVHITAPASASPVQTHRFSGFVSPDPAASNAALKRQKLRGQLDRVAAQLEALRHAAAKARAAEDADAVRRTDKQALILAEKLAKVQYAITKFKQGKQKPVLVRLDKASEQAASKRLRLSDELLAKAEYYKRAGKREMAAEYVAKAKALMAQAQKARMTRVERNRKIVSETPLIVDFTRRRTEFLQGKQKPVVVRLDNAFEQATSKRLRMSDELLAKAEYYKRAGKHEMAAKYAAKAKALMAQAQKARTVRVERKREIVSETPLIVDLGRRRTRSTKRAAPARDANSERATREQLERLHVALRALMEAGLKRPAAVVEREIHEHEMRLERAHAEGRGPDGVVGELGALRREVRDLRGEVKELSALVRRLLGSDREPVSRRRR